MSYVISLLLCSFRLSDPSEDPEVLEPTSHSRKTDIHNFKESSKTLKEDMLQLFGGQETPGFSFEI